MFQQCWANREADVLVQSQKDAVLDSTFNLSRMQTECTHVVKPSIIGE